MKLQDVTDDIFDGALETMVDGMNGSRLLSIPGIYEILSEELNNDILSSLVDDEED